MPSVRRMQSFRQVPEQKDGNHMHDKEKHMDPFRPIFYLKGCKRMRTVLVDLIFVEPRINRRMRYRTKRRSARKLNADPFCGALSKGPSSHLEHVAAGGFNFSCFF